MVSVICDKMERFTKCIDEDIAEKSEVTHMMSRAQTSRLMSLFKLPLVKTGVGGVHLIKPGCG
jgi:hypothetical protein